MPPMLLDVTTAASGTQHGPVRVDNLRIPPHVHFHCALFDVNRDGHLNSACATQGSNLATDPNDERRALAANAWADCGRSNGDRGRPRLREGPEGGEDIVD